MRRSKSLACLTFCIACGGKVLVYGGEGDAGPTCTVAGARICGGTCGVLSDCPGSCVTLVEGDGSLSTYGVCFSDLSDKGTTACALCDSGEGCVERAPDVFVCVPLDLCGDLEKLGARNVCWYADKSPFDGRPIVAPASCSDPEINHVPSMCGGACGRCATQYGALDRCVGQGPDHPAGMCVYGNFGGPVWPTCTADGSVPCPAEGACAFFAAPPADPGVANENGVCLDYDECHELHSALPGGIECIP